VSKRSLWRLIATLLICSACAFFFVPLSKVKLGLDLRGGVHFEVEVQGHEALEADLRDTRDRVQILLSQENGLPGLTTKLEGDKVLISGVTPEVSDRVEKLLEKNFRGYSVSSSANELRLEQTSGFQKELKQSANSRAIQIIEKRINSFGVAEPEITPTGTEGNRIVVELPGVGEAERERIKNLLAVPGNLEKRLLAKGSMREGYATKEVALAAFNGQLPANTELLPEPVNELDDQATDTPRPQAKPGEQDQEVIGRWYLVESRVYVDGSHIKRAWPGPRQGTEAIAIHFELDSKGADDFYTLSKIASSEDRKIVISLDRKVVSALGCEKPIAGGGVEISSGSPGGFNLEYAQDFAKKLESGAMRASIKFLEERAVGPSLGADSIKDGVRAALLGFLVVVGFMLFFYRWSGMNAIAALTVNIIVMLGLLGSFNAVITLPGIAGFALTIGMAVDANILIFERIKEEMRNGKSVAGAIQAGFDKVFWTIVDSHVTQLFAAMLLFIFGTGPVKGFAVTLTVGVIASLFTSIYISRFIYDWILERHPGTTTLSVGTHSFFEGSTFDFMRWKGVALAVSWSIIVICILAAQPWKGSKSPIKLGMQFVGGIDMQVRYKGDVHQDSLRSALSQGGFGDAAVVKYENKSGYSDYSIKVKARKGQDEKDSTTQIRQIHKILQSLDPAAGQDARPDLNIEPALALTDKWVTTNPLGVTGEVEAIRKTYEPLVSKITATREKLGFISSFDQLPQELPGQLKEQLSKEYRLGTLTILKNESFSPSISGEWTWKTLQAVGWALLAILVYVIFRFTLSFSIGGIVALIHDILMALGLFVLFGFEFSVPVVASFLILIGYSMADTIVVFDRIRENSHKPEYRRATISKLVNDSINQTLSRTILTSCSVLFVAFCLFQFGGVALRDLAFPIFMGVITGTYSSIYIASPVVVYWERWFGSKDNLKQKHA